MNDITACFAFLRYSLGKKENMSRVITAKPKLPVLAFFQHNGL